MTLIVCASGRAYSIVAVREVCTLRGIYPDAVHSFTNKAAQDLELVKETISFAIQTYLKILMDRPSLVLAALSTGGQHPYSPVQVQKLFFLLDRNLPEEVGAPFFAFEPYNYGPFDRQVYDELERLREQGAVEIDHSGQWRLWRLTLDGLERGHAELAKLPPPLSDFIGQSSEFVRSLSFAQLVSSIYQAYPEMKQNSVFSR
ncbi:MAG: hypothetical protein H6974_11195 [Gammaproteobacteria bacterium]|nr:hypothetical protein [Gammaproteobacteria bacterium]